MIDVRGLGDRLAGVARALEQERRLDRVVRPVADSAERVVPTGAARDALHGVWLGHPLHPLLTDLPIGSWTSAMLFDLVPGDAPARAACTLTGFGCLVALPTAAAGAVDWSRINPAEQRVGLVHAAANDVALMLYFLSWRARRKGRRGRGILLGLMGATAATAGAYLGGHLVYRRGVGGDRNADVSPPADWTEAEAVRESPLGEVATVAGDDVLVLADPDGASTAAITARCSHLGGPLEEGRVVTGDGRRCVECPWHRSVFRTDDGSVVHGPATVGQPAYEVERHDGGLRLRARPTPT